MTTIDTTPEPDDIVQDETPDMTTIPVCVEGPVQVRELPAVRAGYSTEMGVGTIGVRLLPFEPRRKSAVIIPVTNAIWISGSQAGAQMGAAASVYVPAGTPFTICGLDQVWACSAVADQVTDVSVMTSFWSE